MSQINGDNIKDRVKKVNILYEDNHLLAVEKPVNVLCQSDYTGDIDLLTILKEDIKRRYNKPGNVYLGLIHRLDRPVGGVMVFARTSKAASRLSEQIRTGQFKKTYLAVVHGIPSVSRRVLENYLLKDGKTNTVYVVSPDQKNSKKAVLEYNVVNSIDKLSLIKINLHTGRPHQIRVQLSAIGHPLYGDQKYGAGVNKPGQQIALWSQRISCIHPTQEKNMVFESEAPSVFPWSIFKKYNLKSRLKLYLHRHLQPKRLKDFLLLFCNRI